MAATPMNADTVGGARSWSGVLGTIVDGGDLGAADADWAMAEIMSDNATSAQIAAFGVGLKMKGVTSVELGALAGTMRRFSRPVRVPPGAIDIVGTGGDRAHTVNISTMASVVLAAAGAVVVKHGNRAASSKSGGADVLEALGVHIDLEPGQVEACVREAGIGFCFAPKHHPALRFAARPRREIGIPTVFNVLGPLTNPAEISGGLVGCAFEDLRGVMAEVFAARGESTVVVRGRDGLDEITITGPSDVLVVVDGGVRAETFDPAEVGIDHAPIESLRGGDATHNADVALRTWAGEKGPIRDAVLLNAAGALAAADGTIAAVGAAEAISRALPRVAEAIDSGAATATFRTWARVSSEV